MNYLIDDIINEIIDDINILNATYSAMHKAIDNLNVEPEFLLVDGNKFNPYFVGKKIEIQKKILVTKLILQTYS